MTADSEAVTLWETPQKIVYIVVHPDGERCIAVWSEMIKLISLHSRKVLLEIDGNFLGTEHAALFNESVLMTIDCFYEICFWSILDGKKLRRANLPQLSFVGSEFHLMASMEKGHFVFAVSQIRGFKVIAYKSKPGPMTGRPGKPTAVSVLKMDEGAVRGISVHKNRFATAGPNDTVQVWAWESKKFLLIKALDVGMKIEHVLLSEEFLIFANDAKNVMHIYNSGTMTFVRKIQCSCIFSARCETPTIRATVNSKLFFGYCKTLRGVALFDAQDGEVLWRTQFEDSILHLDVSLTNGAHLIIATPGKVLQYTLPSDVALQLQPVNNTDPVLAALPPLQAALSSCLAGVSSPGDICDSSITHAACAASFAEWCSAHQILILAVQNRDIQRSSDHRGSIAHWFEKLYLSVKDLELTSEEDFLVAKRYLVEARHMRLIDGIEPILAALHVTNAVNEKVRALHQAGILIFEQVVRNEKRLDMLKATCERYRKYQMYSQCIGIALQIIPIVGGASAGIISAGANLVEGLSVKDVADYAFGLGSSLADGEMSSLGDRVFGCAANSLRPECLAKMQAEDLRGLEDAVSASDLDVKALRHLFKERSLENRTSKAEDPAIEQDYGIEHSLPLHSLPLRNIALSALLCFVLFLFYS